MMGWFRGTPSNEEAAMQAAEDQLVSIAEERDEWGEERANLHQRIGELERQVKRMQLREDDGALAQLSMDRALEIEDLFAMHHDGGRTQRLAKVQIIIREQLRELATGAKLWNAWQPFPKHSVAGSKTS